MCNEYKIKIIVTGTCTKSDFEKIKVLLKDAGMDIEKEALFTKDGSVDDAIKLVDEWLNKDGCYDLETAIKLEQLDRL